MCVLLFVFLAWVPPNHHAVLICGDTPEGARAKVEETLKLIEGVEELEEEGRETVPLSVGLWGLEEALKGKSRSLDEFWNDTYLMWELLYKNGGPDENILRKNES